MVCQLCSHMSSHDLLHILCEFADVVPLGGAYFGEGPNQLQVLLDNVVCQGSESSLLDCQHEPVGMTNCNHTEDAGVRCEGIIL